MDLIKSVCFALLFAFSSLSYAASVNINVADAGTLADELYGIGLSKAKLVVEYRDANGPFTKLEDIQNVKGIGQKTIERNKDIIVIE